MLQRAQLSNIKTEKWENEKNDKHGSGVTLTWATRNPFLATEAHISNFH